MVCVYVKHLKNIFESGELQEDRVISKMETTAADGKKYLTSFYNLYARFVVHLMYNDEAMIRTTSLKHYKELKRNGIACKLVTKQEVNHKRDAAMKSSGLQGTNYRTK